MANRYTVKKGDTLGTIASANGTTVNALLTLNPTITNPDLIYPGQIITLSTATAPKVLKISKLIHFDEKKHYSFYADFRVYIFGVDVTEYVVESTLDWVYCDRDGINEAHFTLQNAYDNFVMTKQNLGIDPETGSKIKPVFRIPKDDKTGGNYSELAKKQLVDMKVKSQGSRDLFPLTERCLVLHKNDPVRIFVQNPISLTEWYYAFTGYVDEVTKDRDYISGQSNIHISCVDIRRMMERMRVQKNPCPSDQAVEILTDTTSFYADMIAPSKFNHPFAKMSFETSMSQLLLGEGGVRSTGVGLMARGDVYEYNPEATKDTDTSAVITRYESKNEAAYKSRLGKKLKSSNFSNKDLLLDWYNLCFFGKQKDNTIRPLLYNEMATIGLGTYPNGPYAPDRQKYHMLLPKGGTKTHSLVATEYSNYVEQRDWDNRYNIVREFATTIDYQLWVTPCGDIVFEFPMYEFKPTDFQYENFLTVDDFIISDDIADEVGEVTSVLNVTGAMYSEIAQTNVQNTNASNMPKILVKNDDLALRFGVKVGNQQFPTVVNKKSLSLLGQVEFFRLLANNSRMGMKFSYRPWILPNKPMYNKEEERMGLTYTVTNRLTLFRECATDVVLKYIRRKSLTGEFYFMDGAQSVVATYAKAWNSQAGNSVQIKTTIVDVSTKK